MKDLLGNLITVGCIVAYPSGTGRVATMHFSKIQKLIGPEGSQYAEVQALFLDSEYKFKEGRVGRMDAGLRRCIVIDGLLPDGDILPAKMPEGFDGGEDAFNSLLQEEHDQERQTSGSSPAAAEPGQLPLSGVRPIHVVRPPVPLYSIESYKKLY